MVIISNILFFSVICLPITNLPVLILLVKYYDWQGQSSQTILLLQMMLIHILLLKSNHWITGRGRYSFTFMAALPNKIVANEFDSFFTFKNFNVFSVIHLYKVRDLILYQIFQCKHMNYLINSCASWKKFWFSGCL